MPGKHNDHNFIFFGKNDKNEKYLELPDLARKLINKFHTPRIFMFFKQKNEKSLEFSDLARKMIRKTV
jgi:hypothetical protein